MCYNLVIHDESKAAALVDYLRSLEYVTVSKEASTQKEAAEEDFEIPEWQKELVRLELRKIEAGTAGLRDWEDVRKELGV